MRFNCPIQEDVRQAKVVGDQFVTAIHRLQRDLEVCEFCPTLDDCHLVQSLNQIVDEMILEINDEWGTNW
jgi:hypothetical protein